MNRCLIPLYFATFSTCMIGGWSARLEAIVYDFGGDHVVFAGAERDVELDAGAIRIGITRHFDW